MTSRRIFYLEHLSERVKVFLEILIFLWNYTKLVFGLRSIFIISILVRASTLIRCCFVSFPSSLYVTQSNYENKIVALLVWLLGKSSSLPVSENRYFRIQIKLRQSLSMSTYPNGFFLPFLVSISVSSPLSFVFGTNKHRQKFDTRPMERKTQMGFRSG